MKHAAKIKQTLSLCICGLASAVALSGCVGEASYDAGPVDLDTQTHSLSSAMRAMDECRPILEGGPIAPEIADQATDVRDAYRVCLEQHEVTPPLDPLRICNVVSERVNFALERHQVNCGAPSDLLESTLCDVATYVSDCNRVVPEPQPPVCRDVDCSDGGGDIDRPQEDPSGSGPGHGTDFCSDVRTTVEGCHNRDEPTTLPQQFPECFDEGQGGTQPGDDPNGDGSGFGGDDGRPGEGGDSGGGGWGDSGATGDACRVLMDEMQNCMDEATCTDIGELMEEHCEAGGGGGGGGGGW